MNKPNLIPTTKIDAVVRQLETAITLWFNDGDPISIHTLASAAFQILYDLNKHNKGLPMTPDSDLIKPEYQKEVRAAMKAWSNFLKHADKDPNETIKFNPDINLILLFESVVKYSELTKKKRPPILHCLYAWVFIHHPLYFQTELADNIRRNFQGDDFFNFSRLKFFQETTQIIARNSTDHETPIS